MKFSFKFFIQYAYFHFRQTMNNEYSSDSEDDDYVPEAEEQDMDNELDASSNNDSENESEENNKTKRSSKNRIKRHSDNEELEQKKEEGIISEQDDKKRADNLWSNFLKDTDKPSSVSTIKNIETVSNINTKAISDKQMEKKTNKINELKPMHNLVGVKRSSGGLNSVLNHINKKSKTNTLEKSKLDWNNFKHKEGIDEELNTYNKGKSGYLERQDFLQRTDVRQFEIEKNLRTKRLSDR